MGRPLRNGIVGTAIGVSGLAPLRGLQGESTPTATCCAPPRSPIADELAAAADLVMGKLERAPAALIRGFEARGEGSARRADPRARARPLHLSRPARRASVGACRRPVPARAGRPARARGPRPRPGSGAAGRWRARRSSAASAVGRCHPQGVGAAVVGPGDHHPRGRARRRAAPAVRPRSPAAGRRRGTAPRPAPGVSATSACTSPLFHARPPSSWWPTPRSAARSAAPGSELTSVTGPISASRAAATTRSSMLRISARASVGGQLGREPGLGLVEPLQPDQHGGRHGPHGRGRTARVTRVITLGYKASAEQFAPVGAAATSRWRPSATGSTRSRSPTISSRSGTPAATRRPRCRGWARWRRAASGSGSAPACSTPTMRFHPSMVAQAFATLGCFAPGRIFLGVGTGESMNEVPPLGIEWPGFKRAAGPAGGGDRADQAAVDGGPGQLRRRVLHAPSGRRCTTGRTS